MYEFDSNTFQSWLGLHVKKKSGKPFKSTFKINTIKSVDTLHPITGRPCFKFNEDDSYVECGMCEIILTK